MESSADRPLKITADELDRAVPLSMRGFAPPSTCPVCGIMNDAGAIECRSCGEPFDAQTAGTGRRRRFVPRCSPEEIHTARVLSSALFAVSLLGVLSPVVLVLGVLLLVQRHRAVVQAGSAFVALAYSAVLLSLVYLGGGLWVLLS